MMHILIVRVSSLGDVVHNLPVTADIHAHFPEAKIDWVVEEAFAGIVARNQYVNRVIPFNLRQWKKGILSSATREAMKSFIQDLQTTQYDYVFDTQGLLKTGIILGFSKTAPGGKKIGLGNQTDGSSYEPLSRMFHNQSITLPKHIHVVDRSREMIAKALGYTIDTQPDFGLTIGEIADERIPKKNYAVFFHATSRASKKWANENWYVIGKRVHETGLTILLPWGSINEKAEAEVLAKSIPGSIVLPRLSIENMVTLTGRASLVVGVDTGLTHLAAAFHLPTVQVYCNIVRWRTCGTWSDRVISLGGENEVPTLQEVLNALETLLLKIKMQ